MNFLSFKTSKKLYSLGFFNDLDIGNLYYYENVELWQISNVIEFSEINNFDEYIPALTLEDALTFLKLKTNSKNGYQDLWNAYINTEYKGGSNIEIVFEFCNIEKIDKMINFLLDNNILINE